MHIHALEAPAGDNPALRSSAEQRTARMAAPEEGAFRAAIAPASAPAATHVVREGENLTHIVQARLDAQGRRLPAGEVYKLVQQVAKENRIENPDLIFPGQRLALNLPALQQEAQLPPSGKTLPLLSTHASAPSAPPEAAAPHTPPVLALRSSTAVTVAPTRAIPLVPQPHGLAAGGTTSRFAAPAPGALLKVAAAVGLRLPGRSKQPVDAQREIEHAQRNAAASTIAVAQTPSTARRGSPWSQVLEGDVRLSSPYGNRKDPFTGRKGFHDGIDFAVAHGTPIRPIAPGTVAFSGWRGGYGRVVVVKHENGLESMYAHNSENLVQKGDKVGANEILGHVGSTGRSTGPHLHLEIRQNGKAVDPTPYLRAGMQN